MRKRERSSFRNGSVEKKPPAAFPAFAEPTPPKWLWLRRPGAASRRQVSIFPCSRTPCTLRAQKWLWPCCTDFFEPTRSLWHSRSLCVYLPMENNIIPHSRNGFVGGIFEWSFVLRWQKFWRAIPEWRSDVAVNIRF